MHSFRGVTHKKKERKNCPGTNERKMMTTTTRGGALLLATTAMITRRNPLETSSASSSYGYGSSGSSGRRSRTSGRILTRHHHQHQRFAAVAANATNRNGNNTGVVRLIRVEDDDDENDANEKNSSGSGSSSGSSDRRRSRRRNASSSSSSSRQKEQQRLPKEYDKVANADSAAAAKEKMFQILRDSASWDPDVEKLLDGIDANDPDAIEEAIRKRFEEKKSGVYKPLNEDGDEGSSESGGSQTPTLVFFRQVQTQNLWVWMEARNTIEDKEKEFFDEAIKSWFVVGKLGGYNVENQQCLESASVLNDTISHLDYDVARSHDRTSASLFHAIGEVEYRGKWARVWMDLGTADEMAIDVLINSLITLSREYVGIKQIVIGGDNENGWGTEDSGYGQEQGKQFEDFDPAFDEMFGDMRGMRGKPNAEDSNWMSR
jgi:hypothetical protein